MCIRDRPNCRCFCHKQPIAELRRHEEGKSIIDLKRRTVSDTRLKRISAGIASGGRGSNRVERGGASSQRMTSSGSSGHFYHPKDSDGDDDEADRDLQRLKSAIANRLRSIFVFYYKMFILYCRKVFPHRPVYVVLGLIVITHAELCRSAWVGFSSPSFCLSVCMFVCPQYNSKTNNPKVFKLGVGNDLGIP